MHWCLRFKFKTLTSRSSTTSAGNGLSCVAENCSNLHIEDWKLLHVRQRKGVLCLLFKIIWWFYLHTKTATTVNVTPFILIFFFVRLQIRSALLWNYSAFYQFIDLSHLISQFTRKKSRVVFYLAAIYCYIRLLYTLFMDYPGFCIRFF